MKKQSGLFATALTGFLVILANLSFSVSLSADQADLVKRDATGPLVVGVNPSYKPLAFKHQGKLIGIEPETAAAVGKQLRREILFKELEWEALIPALERGDIDVIMSGMSVTKERRQRVDFTDTYLEIGQMAIIRLADIDTLRFPGALFDRGRAVGVEPQTTGESYAKEFLTAATLKPYNNPQDAFSALRAGEIDYYIHDAPTSWEIAQSRNLDDLMPLYRPLTQESLAWAVRKGDSTLLTQLNQALSALTNSGTVGLIQNRWIPVKVQTN